MKSFKEKYGEYLLTFEGALKKYLEAENTAPLKLVSAVKYSLTAGGKRVRPVLFLAALDALGIDYKNYAEFSVCFELIHTYSLIHDDLPCMDNDDYRRGKLTNHKVYGEAMALLAGDALLNNAFELGLNLCLKNNIYVAPLKYLAECSGMNGMIGGQALDVESADIKATSENLLYIASNKTAKMLCAPLVCAALIAGGEYTLQLEKYGEALGLLFQTTDDILDEIGDEEKVGKKLHKDAFEKKITAVSVFGLENAKLLAAKYYEESLQSIKDLKNNEFLKTFTFDIYNRKN